MKKVLFIIIFLGLLTFQIVFALEVDWPPSPFSPTFTLTDTSNLTDMVRYFYEWGIFIGGIAVFIALLIGGFLYLTSAGDPGRMKEAKDRIFSALVGLVLLFSIYLILNTINPELTILTPPSFEPTEVESPSLEGFVEESAKSCEYVRLYSETYYLGNSCKLYSEPDPPVKDPKFVAGEEECKDGGDDLNPKSVRFFQECEPNEICRNERIVEIQDGQEYETTQICEQTGDGCFKDGGACTLELHSWNPGWLGFIGPGCGDKIGSASRSQHNLKLSLEVETDIACVKLTKTGLE